MTTFHIPRTFSAVALAFFLAFAPLEVTAQDSNALLTEIHWDLQAQCIGQTCSALLGTALDLRDLEAPMRKKLSGDKFQTMMNTFLMPPFSLGPLMIPTLVLLYDGKAVEHYQESLDKRANSAQAEIMFHGDTQRLLGELFNACLIDDPQALPAPSSSIPEVITKANPPFRVSTKYPFDLQWRTNPPRGYTMGAITDVGLELMLRQGNEGLNAILTWNNVFACRKMTRPKPASPSAPSAASST